MKKTLFALLLALPLLAACGGEPRAFGRPTLLAAFPDGARYVLYDADDPRLLVLDAGHRLLATIRHERIGTAWGLSVNATGEILLSCRRVAGKLRTEAERSAATVAEILLFSAGGALLRAHAFPVSAGELSHPSTPRMVEDGTIFVGDFGRDRVVRIDGAGAITSFFGRPGTGPDELRYPNDLVPLPGDRFLIVETYNSRLQSVDAAGRHAGFPATRGTAEGALLHPEYACLDRAGNLHVTEMGAMRVSTFGPDLAFRRAVDLRAALPGRPLVQPFGVATLESPFRLLVADAKGGAVHLFDESGRLLESLAEARP